MRKIASSFAVISAAVIIPQGSAAVNISHTAVDGPATYTSTAEPNPTSSSVATAAMTNDGGADQLYGNGWFWRMPADTRELQFSAAGMVEINAGNTATRTWANPTGIGVFSAVLTYTLTDGPLPGQALLTQEMAITNTATFAYVLSLFNFLEADLEVIYSDDSAVLLNPDTMRVTDPLGTFLDFQGVGANNYQAEPFPNLDSLLTDNAITNLANTGLPFGPGDWGGAFQWNVLIPLGQTVRFVANINLHQPPPPTGACCLNFQCQELSQFNCQAAGGTYLGDGTVCAAGICSQRVSHTEKGTLVIFPDVEVKWDGTDALTQDTFIQLTNDNTTGVDVQMFFVNGDQPLDQQPPLPAPATERAHPGCNNVDNQVHLTANQPTYWSALRGAPAVGGLSPWIVLDPTGIGGPGRPDLDPGAAPGSRYLRGFIIAFAVNSNNDPICWNHLAGNATIVNYRNGTAWEYNGFSFQCVNPLLDTGDVIGTPGDGVLNLDGFNYAYSFDQLLMNFQAVGANAFSGPKQVITNSDLTLHIVSTDLRENNNGPKITKAKFDVWNQNEVKFSNAERCITCWYQALLGTWAPNANHFIRANLQTNVGKARIDGLESPVVCGPSNGGVAGGGLPLPHGSSNESLLGVISSLLVYDAGVAYAETGTNLVGMGYESAQIRYDVLTSPPPPANGGGKTPQRIQNATNPAAATPAMPLKKR